ncbi:GTP-binding protein [Aliivibrio fischeri]|uniref:GTPase family protein n=1 Tax=Aliivibrio fischeri TaxID=668 RepID=UPI0012D87D1D|nr:GTPase [Aliivibrio fischeri]MUJ27461.1 GTP-binding protein [Aliivibrio fischeri]MUK61557.1 GTP-binding protein [Aliivibrio fischeri]MUL15829.1 GTP-binding protein [Aliivibrio fischeri]MUL22172.1 GTP-binding protein [Aliivibrio fischeri]MUL25613.1 GTP-binding protein [Aliivibrio fischeri]
MKENNIFKDMENDVNASNLDEHTKQKFFSNILHLKNKKINLMITGATGCGKSSTINAMFNTDVAKVGMGVDPETMDIRKYELDNLILWDSPGLGDGKEKDIQHSKGIISKLNELDENGLPLIDLVLVILDGGSRDLGTSYELINSVIIPNLGENPKDRILIAINQADVAMKGRYWDFQNNKPEPKLVSFLEEKVESVKNRVKEATGVDIKPIYYSAGFKDEGEEQRPYNLSKLLYFIVKNTPLDKRLVYVNTTSDDKNMWSDNDEIKNYTAEIQKSFVETIVETSKVGGKIGKELGDILGMGKTGEAIGKVTGAVVGAFKSVVSSIFSWF